jgi:hypothetical protein
MRPPAFNLLTIPYTLAGVPIFSRGLTVALVYSSTWRPPVSADSQTPWSEDEYIQNCWRHRDFPDHIVWAPAPGQLFVAHTSMTSSAPKRATVHALALAALGPSASPVREVMLPLSLRVPLQGPGRLTVPERYFRCDRFWPPSNEPPELGQVDGVPVELRVSGTRGATGLSVWAEAFIGWSHVDAPDAEGKERPRAMVFGGDARRLVVPQNESDVKRLVAGVMDRLLGFAYWRGEQGLEVDRHGHLPGRLVGRVQVPAHVADIEFAIRLPQPDGTTTRFIGDYAVVS